MIYIVTNMNDSAQNGNKNAYRGANCSTLRRNNCGWRADAKDAIDANDESALGVEK